MAARSPIRIATAVLVVLVIAGLVSIVNRGARQVSSAANRAVAAWSTVEQEFKARAGIAPAMADLARRLDATGEELAARIIAAADAIEKLAPDPGRPYAPDRFRAFMGVQDALSVPLGQVLDLVNAHPAEAADPTVKELLARLAAHEQRIVVARSDYVANARTYNAEIEGIPNRWTVSFFHPDASQMVASFDFR
jgi:hypothetical protein